MAAIDTRKFYELINNDKFAVDKGEFESNLMLCLQNKETLENNEKKRLLENIGTVLYNLKQELVTIGDIKERIPENSIINIRDLKLSIAEILYIALS